MFHVALCTDNSRSLHQLSVNIQRLPHPPMLLRSTPFSRNTICSEAAARASATI